MDGCADWLGSTKSCRFLATLILGIARTHRRIPSIIPLNSIEESDRFCMTSSVLGNCVSLFRTVSHIQTIQLITNEQRLFLYYSAY